MRATIAEQQVAGAVRHLFPVEVVNDAAERYYKVQEFMKEIQDSQTQAQERVANINEEGKALEQEYQELVEQAGSDILTEEARNDAKEDARIKYQEIAQKQNELRQFAENVQRQLAARQSTQMSLFTKLSDSSMILPLSLFVLLLFFFSNV